jgi:hypothetical protein
MRAAILTVMSAAAVIYVGDLGRMRAFYQGCFQLTTADSGPGYHGLRSDSWLLTLVQSAAAVPTTNPPTRRADTPIKLSSRSRASTPSGRWRPAWGARSDLRRPPGSSGTRPTVTASTPRATSSRSPNSPADSSGRSASRGRRGRGRGRGRGPSPSARPSSGARGPWLASPATDSLPGVSSLCRSCDRFGGPEVVLRWAEDAWRMST